MRAKFGVLEQTHGIRVPAKFRLDRFILSPSGIENPNFAFFRLRHLVVLAVAGNLRNLNTGAQRQTFPYPSASRSFLTQTPSWRNGRTSSDVQKRDEQTDRQTTQRFWPPQRRVKFEPHQTWHDDRGPRACSCISKAFGRSVARLYLSGGSGGLTPYTQRLRPPIYGYKNVMMGSILSRPPYFSFHVRF